MIRFDSILYGSDSIMAVNVLWLGVSWGFGKPNVSIKDRTSKCKTNFKVCLKPQLLQTAVVRSLFFVTTIFLFNCVKIKLSVVNLNITVFYFVFSVCNFKNAGCNFKVAGCRFIVTVFNFKGAGFNIVLAGCRFKVAVSNFKVAVANFVIAVFISDSANVRSHF